MNETSLDQEIVKVELTRDEARVLKYAIQDWIERTARKRMWPWRTLGWTHAFIYSRDIYCSARDKLVEALAKKYALADKPTTPSSP
jgi:hypothetical protein